LAVNDSLLLKLPDSRLAALDRGLMVGIFGWLLIHSWNRNRLHCLHYSAMIRISRLKGGKVKSGLRCNILAVMGMFLLGIALAHGQAAPEKPLMAEEVFKNLQVLKGIPVNQFMATMSFFAAATGLNCTDCHVTQSLEDWTRFADDVPRKQTARRMVQMVNALNKASFGGTRTVTCYTCHRGGRPKNTPNLAEQYGTPSEDPNEVEVPQQAQGAPSPDQVFDRYIQALGGAQRLAGLASYIVKGTYAGYDTDHVKVPMEIYAKAPGQRALFVHTKIGDDITVFDGKEGWMATVDKPVPVLPMMRGGELDGAKLDADLLFSGGIKQALTQWRVGFPPTIDDREVQVVQGNAAGGSRAKLYFDTESGLLVRVVRYTDTVVGTNPTEIDYSDYRDVAGVKMPFHWVLTWTGGRSTFDVTEVQPNAPIDAAKFAKPAAPVLKSR
jgi:photosynthetic reaction center cytochrome c subunit